MPRRHSIKDPQYHRYSYTQETDKFYLLGQLWNEEYLSEDGSTKFCPEASRVGQGNVQTYEFYLKDGVYDPRAQIQASAYTGARSNYIMFPYQRTSAEWKRLISFKLDNDKILYSSSLWNIHHEFNGISGWNIAKVDGRIKFIQSKKASAYQRSGLSFYDSWPDTAPLRNMLLAAFDN